MPLRSYKNLLFITACLISIGSSDNNFCIYGTNLNLFLSPLSEPKFHFALLFQVKLLKISSDIQYCTFGTNFHLFLPPHLHHTPPNSTNFF